MFKYVIPLCFFCSAASAQDVPGADQYLAYETAMEEMQQLVMTLESMMSDKEVDKERGRVVIAELSNHRESVELHLTNAIAEGNAAAIYMKARLVRAGAWSNSNKSAGREIACALYEEAAQKGLVAGAVAYVNCLAVIYPPTPEVERSRVLLRRALEGQDLYQAAYPFPISHAYCFERKLEPIGPDEDPTEKLKQFGQPVALTSEQFRAEGSYLLAAAGLSKKKEQAANDLNSAFQAGCQTDGMRLKPRLLSVEKT